MRKFVAPFIAVVLVLMNFQNCSPSHTAPGSFSLSSIYPYYDEKPTYFESMQLTQMEDKGNGVWKYQFVATIVNIDDPSQDVDVVIQILDENDVVLCPRTEITVNSTNNDIVIDDCQANRRVTKAKISLSAKLHSSTGAVEPVKEYVFNL